ncbi:MAG: DUF1573 domain-containing protein [Cytophagales bacterium]|nr:MAG: DUF1573 domain-containing protein [Cytophagales bacterium]
MKLFIKILISIVLLSNIACDKKVETNSETTAESTEQKDQKYARILFDETEFNFGKINQGDTVRHTFTFKNDSDEPLLISNASASCGCTIPEWPKEPVAPGASGVITVKFNSTGKSGVQNKTVIVTANTLPNVTNVSLKGEVAVVAKKDSTSKK